MFTLSNDSIRVDVIPNNRGRKLSQDIPREKRMREAENLGYDVTKTLHARLMYYDLKKLTSNEN